MSMGVRVMGDGRIIVGACFGLRVVGIIFRRLRWSFLFWFGVGSLVVRKRVACLDAIVISRTNGNSCIALSKKNAFLND